MVWFCWDNHRYRHSNFGWLIRKHDKCMCSFSHRNLGLGFIKKNLKLRMSSNISSTEILTNQIAWNWIFEEKLKDLRKNSTLNWAKVANLKQVLFVFFPTFYNLFVFFALFWSLGFAFTEKLSIYLGEVLAESTQKIA